MHVTDASSEPVAPAPNLPVARASFMLAFAAVCLLLLTVFRAVLLASHWEASWQVSVGLVVRLFFVGARLDAAVVGAMCVPLGALLLVLPEGALKRTRRVLIAYVAAFASAVVFAELAGLYFFDFYGCRLNYLVLEHGADREVISTVWSDYPVLLIVLITAGLVVASVYGHGALTRLLLLRERRVRPVLRRWVAP